MAGAGTCACAGAANSVVIAAAAPAIARVLRLNRNIVVSPVAFFVLTSGAMRRPGTWFGDPDNGSVTAKIGRLSR
ncbi:hypothetical protein GCM10009828_004460 [Actinoplanes couchii]